MALLRLICSPLTTCFPAKPRSPTTLSSFQKPPQSNHFSISSLSVSNSFISHKLSSRTRRIGHFFFHLSATTEHSAPSSSSASSAVDNTVPESETEEVSRTRLCAQNVPWTCNADDIRALFEKHGTVLDVELSMHNKTRNRGLAFVTMSSPEEALAALTNLESYDFEGRTLKVNYARPRKKKPLPPKPSPRHDLFVANLSYEATDKDLREFFGAGNGNVVSAEVIFHDNPRRPSGYGFVSFSSKVVAETARTAFQGKMFMGRPIRVERSRRFVKLESKVGIQSEETSSELNPDVVQSEKSDDIRN